MSSELQQRAVDAIRAFNDAVTATRMHPAMAPQVGAAVGRALQSISAYVQVQNELHLGIDEEHIRLLGQQVDEGQQGQLRQLAIVKQFALLGLNNLVFNTNLTEDVLRQIIFVFTARKEKIAREGGGAAFISTLGLDENFPADYSPSEHPDISDDDDDYCPVRVDGLSPLHKQLIIAFLEKDLTEDGAARLAQTIPEEEKKLSLLLNIINAVFLSPVDETTPFDFHLYFTHALREFGKIVPAEQSRPFAERVVKELFSRADNDLFLSHLLMQEMEGNFGNHLFQSMLYHFDLKAFKVCMELLRQKEEELSAAGDTEELELVKQKHAELLDTEKGKQFLGGEKARALLENSDKDRQEEELSSDLDKITGDDITEFDSEEIIISLPAEIDQLLTDGQQESVAQILTRLNSRMESGDDEVVLRLTRALCLTGEILVKREQTPLLQRIVKPLLSWVETSDNGDSVYEKIVEILQATSNLLLKDDDLETSAHILHVFCKIRSGEIKKTPPVKALVGRVQDRSIDRSIFDHLLKDFFTSPETSKNGDLILAHGNNGIHYLLEKVSGTEDGNQRKLLRTLLGSVQAGVLSAEIVKMVKADLPWYGKKMLLILLADCGNETHIKEVLTFFKDPDLRVQSEALNSLQKIGGSQLKKGLLQALPVAGYSVKAVILKALTPICDDSIAKNLIEVLHGLIQGNAEVSEGDREAVVINACKALSNCHAQEILVWMKKFLQKARSDSRMSANAVTAVEQAVMMLGMTSDGVDELPDISTPTSEQQKTQPAAVEKTEKANLINPDITGPSRAAVQANPVTLPAAKGVTFLPEEKKIRDLFAQGQDDKAVALLVKLINATAKKKKFEQADKLREMLVEMAPMSLTEIIQTAELIEEEKTLAIDRGHFEVWAELYDALNPDEFSTLYHSMQHRKYGSGEMIIKQHTQLSALFFVNSGKIKLYYSDVVGSDVLVKVVGAGEIIGVDSFFNASVWTINAATMGHADVSMLRFDKLQKWKEEYPALESKLYDYSLKFESLKDYFKHNTKDRREDERSKLTGRVSSLLLDKKGNPTNIGSKGELSDVSCGGISFFMRISKKENARVLLGHSIRLQVPAKEVAGKVINVDGVIVAVRAHLAMENEFSVHIKFMEKLNRTDIQKMLRASKE